MMGVVGAAIKGFGRALMQGKKGILPRKTGAILAGKKVGQKLLRKYRLATGIRGKTITGVKPALKVPGASVKDIEKSRTS